MKDLSQQQFNEARERISSIAESLSRQSKASATLAAQDREKTLTRKHGSLHLTEKEYARQFVDLVIRLGDQKTCTGILDTVSSMTAEQILYMYNEKSSVDGTRVQKGTRAIIDGLLVAAAFFIEEAASMMEVLDSENPFHKEHDYLAV